MEPTGPHPALQPHEVLAVRGLRVQFRRLGQWADAVRGASFSVAKGKTLGIVGESGSGKSVSALSILNLLAQPPGRIAGGEIWFRSKQHGPCDLLKFAHPVKRSRPPGSPPTVMPPMYDIRGGEIGMVFQEPMSSLNPVLTCGAQVAEVLAAHRNMKPREAKQETLRLFEEVRLPNPAEFLKAFPHQISGGQKQRVMIAMAIACNPVLLIADEPTTALDVTVQKSILELLERLQQQCGMSLLFITHDLGVLAEIADDVAVMRQGEVVEHGPIAQVLQAPRHPYTQGLVACKPQLGARPNRLPTVADFLKADPGTPILQLPRFREVGENQLIERLNQLQALEPILKVSNLSTVFRARGRSFFGKRGAGHVAVDNISFEVYPGEVFGLVGESGSGKTTLGRSILRLTEPQEGEVWFRGQNLLALGPRQLRPLRRHIQIVFQDPFGSLNPRQTIGTAITEPMAVHRIGASATFRKQRALALLEKVSLPADAFHRYPHEFSGGQRQRACIARALALNPELIILDESVSALDVSVQAQVVNLLKDLQADFGLTYIFISHDLSIVKYISDRIMVLHKGAMVECAPASHLYARPQHAYTKSLLAAIPQGRPQDVAAAQARRQR